MKNRELDVLVAKHVMKLDVEAAVAGQILDDDCGCKIEIPHYSTDIAAAWDVVEKLKIKGFDFVLHWKTAWECIFWFGRDKWFESNCETAPRAICLAALKAVGVEVK